MKPGVKSADTGRIPGIATVQRMTRLLFTLFIALDVAALGLWFVLGLAAAKPSHTPLSSLLLFFLLPAAVLAGIVLLYLRGPWPAARLLAVVLAGLPVLLVLSGAGVSRAVAWWHGESFENWAQPDPVVQKQLDSAIAAGDAAGVARIAGDPRASFNQGAALVAALKRLEQHPQDLDLVRALLKAGADANAGGADMAPLAAAIYVSGKAGLEPVRLLLDAGADPNSSRGMQPAWFDALPPSVPASVLPELLSRGAKLAAVDMAGNTALYWTVFHRNWSATALLLERGIDWRNARMPGDGIGLRHRLADELRRHPNDAALQKLSRFDWSR